MEASTGAEFGSPGVDGRLSPGRLASAFCGQRFLAARVEGEHVLQAGELEGARDAGLAAHDRQSSAALLQTHDRANENAEASSIDEGDVRHVDGEAPDLALKGLFESFLEARRGVDVDLALDHDDNDVLARTQELDTELSVLGQRSSRRSKGNDLRVFSEATGTL